MSGVRITILNTGLSTFSDSQGNYEIRNAPRGIWRIRTSLTDHKQETHKLIIHESFSSDIDEDFFWEYNFQIQEGGGEVEHNELWIFFSLAIIMMIFSLFVIAGAFLAFKQKRFAVVLVGGILGVFTMTPALLFPYIPSIFIMGAIGFMLSTFAMITTITNRKEFAENTHSHEAKVQKEPAQAQDNQPEVSQSPTEINE
jgi:lipopolysaccharide export LptBFGC system permease protein LptF